MAVRTHRPLRLRAGTQVAIGLLALAVLVLVGLVTSLYVQKPYVGGQALYQQGAWVITDIPWGSLAQVQGVRTGSQIVAVNGKSIEDFASGSTFIPSRKVHSLTVREPGGGEKVVSDATGSAPWQTKLAGIALGLLAFLFWLAAVVVWAKKPGLRTARLFALLGLSSALLIASIMGAQYDLEAMVVIRTLAYIFVPAVFLHLCLAFPRSLLPSRGSFFIYLYLPALLLVLVYAAWRRQEAVFNTWFKQAVFLYLSLASGGGVIAWAYGYFTTTYERHRLQTRLVLASVLLGVLPVLGLSLAPQLIYQSSLLPSNVLLLGTGIIPLAFGYIIVQEKLPAVAKDRTQVDSRTEATSLAAFATLAGDLETMSSYVVQYVAAKLGVSDACLLVTDGGALRIAAAVGHWASDPAEQARLPGWAASVTEDHLFPSLAPRGSGCQLLVPLESRGQLVGMLCLGAKTAGGSFKQRDIDLLSDLRKSIVVPLHNAILLNDVNQTRQSLKESLEETRNYARELENAKRSLEEAYIDMGRTLVLMLESRDHYTRGHCERVTRLCRSIAQGLKLSAEAIETIHMAAMFHDIGKVSIPDSILLKPGPLAPQERAELELHPARSVEILRFLSFMEKALPIVESHHEAWDGSGYPRGLRGEEIPLGARILAVADAYDAMTSSRPYRAAFGTAEALQYLKAGAGTQWDPGVVHVFLRALPEMDR